jgi:2-polyprenyl-3-methyl-5-hydroxy-6-metoxy-1,4-benzoquinol methylase
VLDVGCSRGATAAALRLRGVREVVGIEPDAEDASEAARVCDRVLPVALESVAEEFDGRFDAILFGDVLEHLENPAAALAKVRPWLSDSGAVVASVPNVGHWSVIADLAAGRFDYVPYSILSGTHVRFFTRRTLVDLFEGCGYEARSIEAVRFEPSPEGAKKLERLRSVPGASPDLDAVEFIAVAARIGT